MYVDDFITALELRIDNAYDDEVIVDFINEVELAVYEEVYKEYRLQFYNRTKNIYQLSLPSGVLWDDVYSMFVNDVEYQKRTLLDHEYLNSYYYDESKINLYPVPDENDVNYVSGTSEITFKAISYTSGASELTFASSTIVTTGDSFVTAGFVVNNVIEITNCIDQTGNNITATITAVTASTLTFATGTFTAQAETGTVSIKTNCIYTEGSNFVGFTVDEYVLVSGCTDETANNKYARIAYVKDDVLTFAEGTFTAQVETSAVTIKQPKIKMVYRYKRTAKAVADIATDELLLPDVYRPIYYYYCYAQISLLNREFPESEKYMRLYDAKVQDYMDWHEERREMAPDTNVNDGWR